MTEATITTWIRRDLDNDGKADQITLNTPIVQTQPDQLTLTATVTYTKNPTQPRTYVISHRLNGARFGTAGEAWKISKVQAGETALSITGKNQNNPAFAQSINYEDLLPQSTTQKVAAEQQQFDKEITENAGVIAALRDYSSLDSAFGTTGLNADTMTGIGGLIDTKGTQMGSGGLGGRGSGLGGGGTADSIGGLGTRGRGSGASGYGPVGGSFGTKSLGGVAAVGGDPTIIGALDKSLIDAVIKRNMTQIQYCYQRELPKNPTLAGKIVVKFVIAKDGMVSSATIKSSTMTNPSAESCICGRFMKFQFPEPKGGGVVIVSYPFVFSPG